MKLIQIVLGVIWSTAVCAQEEQYYKAIDKRRISHEIENLPNLDSKFTTFYLGASGALRRTFVGQSSGFSDFANHPVQLRGWLEGIVGFNMNNTYFIETGVVRTRNDFTSHVYATQDYPGFGIGMSNEQWYIPLTVKRRLLGLNRVTKNAYINVGLGAGLRVHSSPKAFGNYSADINEQIRNPALESFDVTLVQSDSPIYGEVNVELKGNVTERLEVVVFFKGQLRNSDFLRQKFEIRYNGGRMNRSFEIWENPASLAFGIQARFNSRKYYTYKSRI
jgi:hypothetical protein